MTRVDGGSHRYRGRRVGRAGRLVSKLGTAATLARLELLLPVEGDRARAEQLARLRATLNARRVGRITAASPAPSTPRAPRGRRMRTQGPAPSCGLAGSLLAPAVDRRHPARGPAKPQAVPVSLAVTTPKPESTPACIGELMERGQPVVLDPDGSMIEATPRNTRDFTREQLQELLGCKWIEIVQPRSTPGWVLVIDEAGKLNGTSRVNFIASVLYGYRSDLIVGRVLFAPSRMVL
jgi:hypothetical protein